MNELPIPSDMIAERPFCTSKVSFNHQIADLESQTPFLTVVGKRGNLMRGYSVRYGLI